MKKYITIIILLVQAIVFACPVCERNQPKILRGIVHGAGPESNWDYVSIWLTIIIAIITLIYSLKYLIIPGEKNKNHIKYFILK